MIALDALKVIKCSNRKAPYLIIMSWVFRNVLFVYFSILGDSLFNKEIAVDGNIAN